MVCFTNTIDTCTFFLNKLTSCFTQFVLLKNAIMPVDFKFSYFTGTMQIVLNKYMHLHIKCKHASSKASVVVCVCFVIQHAMQCISILYILHETELGDKLTTLHKNSLKITCYSSLFLFRVTASMFSIYYNNQSIHQLLCQNYML